MPCNYLKDIDVFCLQDTHCKPGLNPYKRLRNLFRDLCDHYARVSSPEAKEAAILDHVGDQPIFFLMAQPDSLTELLPSKKKGQDRQVPKSWFLF